MPNYFIFTGPNATVGHGSLIYSLDWAAEWMIKWFRKMLADDIASVAPKQEVVDDFVRYGDKVMERFVWTSGCKYLPPSTRASLRANVNHRPLMVQEQPSRRARNSYLCRQCAAVQEADGGAAAGGL